jgi:dihydroorotate dehydrogenase
MAKLRSGHVLNAVELSGPGAKFLFELGRWQKRTRPFCLSFMAVGPTREKRLEEMYQFVELARYHLPHFQAEVALQLNFGCPNTEHELSELWTEIADMLDIASSLRIPLIPNFSPVVPEKILIKTAANTHCAALCLGNTIPWGNPLIDWKRIFGRETSPLVDRGFGPGGLSGPACLMPALAKLSAVRGRISKPIIVGNGIQSPMAARTAYAVGADAILVGVAGIVRPWRLNSIITAHQGIL